MKKAAILILTLLVFSCDGEKLNENIEMPATPLLTVNSKWGVVNSSYIRITDVNDRHNMIIATLRKGDILEVLSKETEKESDSSMYWYEVRSGEIYGVVPEEYLDIYDSEAKAENASRQM